MKVFAGGIMTETNTFAPFPTGMADYQKVHAADYLPDSTGSDYGNAMDIWYRETHKRGWQFCPGLFAYAQPAGITPRPVYEALRDEMLADLQATMPVDMVLLSLPGAIAPRFTEIAYQRVDTHKFPWVDDPFTHAAPTGKQ